MKAGAPLAASTIIAGEKGIFSYRYFRQYARRRNIHVFTIPELESYLTQAGFEDFHYQVYGCMILFRARKRRVN